MKKIVSFLIVTLLLISCEKGTRSSVILPTSVGSTNKILVVTKGNDWSGKIGDEIRTVFGEHQVGLPQPET